MGYGRSEYWREAVAVALEEAGVLVTEAQLAEIAESVQGSAENMSMAFYEPPASDMLHSETRRLKQQHADELARQEKLLAVAKRDFARLREVDADEIVLLDNGYEWRR